LVNYWVTELSYAKEGISMNQLVKRIRNALAHPGPELVIGTTLAFLWAHIAFAAWLIAAALLSGAYLFASVLFGYMVTMWWSTHSLGAVFQLALKVKVEELLDLAAENGLGAAIISIQPAAWGQGSHA
jgi:hypothetical protein